MMGYNPADLSAFQEEKPKGNPNIYKTSIKLAKSDDGVYRSSVRILLNPMNPRDSIIPQIQYWLNSGDGSRAVKSILADGDKNCPLFKCWKRIWFAHKEGTPEFEADRKRAKELFDRNQSNWVLVQIISDDNQPELVGRIKYWKLPKFVMDILQQKMNPTDGKTKPEPLMDYLVGKVLNIQVTPGPDDPSAPERRLRESKYNLSSFGDFQPVIKTDGTPLLTDDEFEIIDQYVTANNDANNGKTQKKRDEGSKNLTTLRPQVVPIYKKAIEYIKQVCVDEDIDLRKECGYTPWDESTTEYVNRWIEMVDAGVDPAGTTWTVFKATDKDGNVDKEAVKAAVESQTASPATKQSEEDELPF